MANAEVPEKKSTASAPESPSAKNASWTTTVILNSITLIAVAAGLNSTAGYPKVSHWVNTPSKSLIFTVGSIIVAALLTGLAALSTKIRGR